MELGIEKKKKKRLKGKKECQRLGEVKKKAEPMKDKWEIRRSQQGGASEKKRREVLKIQQRRR